MAEHKDLLNTSAHCHQPQGFTAAANSTVLTKSSAGAYAWSAGAVDTVLATSAAGAIGWVTKNSLLGTLPHGHSYISATAATTVTTGATYYKAAGTWTNLEANDITWTTDHFVIVTPGSYTVSIVGDALIAATSVVSLDLNREAAIADGNETGLVPIRAEGQVGSTQILPMCGTFYLEDLVANDLITPMVTHASGDDGTAVTVTLQMFINFTHS